MRSTPFIHRGFITTLLSLARAQAQTTALWLFDEPAGCYAQVGFLGERGQPIPGYSVQDCVYVNGNAVEYEEEWLEKGPDVSSLAGKTVQLVLELHGAELYALQFQQAFEPKCGGDSAGGTGYQVSERTSP